MSIKSLIEQRPFMAGVLASIVAAAIGFFIRNTWYGSIYVWRRFFVKDVLHGEWYAYHWTTDSDGRQLVREEIWTISLGFRSRYTVVSSDPKRPELVYVGMIQEGSHGHLLADMHGKLHDEEYTIRILKPIPSKATETCGLKVGIDFRGTIFATIYLYSRSRLSPANARAKIQQRIERDPEQHLFWLRTAVLSP